MASRSFADLTRNRPRPQGFQVAAWRWALAAFHLWLGTRHDAARSRRCERIRAFGTDNRLQKSLPAVPARTPKVAVAVDAMEPLACLAAAVGSQRFARLALVCLALVTTSPFAPWASVCAALVEPSHALLLCGGLLSGFLAGLLGIGGALVTLPVLYAALPGLGVPVDKVPAIAVATALVAMMPTTVIAAWRQQAHGALNVATLTRLIAPMATGAIGGALLASAVNGPMLALLFAAQAVFYGSGLIAAGSDEGSLRVGCVARRIGRLPCWIAVPGLAAFCACVGMGGGSMVTPYLQQRFHLPFRHAVATSSALNLCIAVGGSLTFFFIAHSGASVSGAAASANVPAVILLAAGALATVSIGVATAHRLPTALFRRAVGAINLIAAISLVMQVMHAA